MPAQTTPQRPYLLRAMHEWMTDNGYTPHVVVDTGVDGVAVPEQYVQDGKIILNISYAATQNLDLGNEQLAFGARFGGVAQQVRVPMQALLGIYARETGQGMIFSDGDLGAEAQQASGKDDSERQASEPRPGRPNLRIIK